MTRIAVIPGDGVGPEVVPEGLRCLEAAGLSLDVETFDWGCSRLELRGAMMPDDALHTLARFDAIYLGAVGWPTVPDHVSLWGLLLPIRKHFDLFVNLRPVRLLPGVQTPLTGRPESDIDMLFLRENTEGEYSGAGGSVHVGTPDEVAVEAAIFTRRRISELARIAFEHARARQSRLVSITKSNASRYGYVLWDSAVSDVAGQFPDVEVERMHVDAMAARMVLNPASIDVVVASNLFGDILTDLGAALQGGVGLAASANLDPTRRHPSMFEPVHGSAPDIAGKGIANPIGAIWAAALMAEHTGHPDAGASILGALEEVTTDRRLLTRDLGGQASTKELGMTVAAAVRASARAAAT